MYKKKELLAMIFYYVGCRGLGGGWIICTRMDIEKTDYSGTVANNRHDPRPTGSFWLLVFSGFCVWEPLIYAVNWNFLQKFIPLHSPLCCQVKVKSIQISSWDGMVFLLFFPWQNHWTRTLERYSNAKAIPKTWLPRTYCTKTNNTRLM